MQVVIYLSGRADIRPGQDSVAAAVTIPKELEQRFMEMLEETGFLDEQPDPKWKIMCLSEALDDPMSDIEGNGESDPLYAVAVAVRQLIRCEASVGRPPSKGEGVTMQAKRIIKMVYDQCRYVWPKDWKGMSKHQLDLLVIAGVFNVKDSGSHKYIPTERLNADLGLPDGAGVYGYHKLGDDSFILLTCSHGLVAWEGGDTKPEFNDFEPYRPKEQANGTS